MPVGTGDLLQFTVFQNYLDEQMLNVYYYRYSSAPTIDNSIYEPLLESFHSRVMDPVISIQNSLCLTERVEVKNLTNGVDFATLLINEYGVQTVSLAGASPSYLSLGFQLIRDSLVTRNGYKRIGALRESDMEGNDYPSFGAIIADIADGFKSSLNVGLLEVAYPIIVKRPIPVPATVGYPYSSVVDCNFKGLGTQNTRKPGRGA